MEATLGHLVAACAGDDRPDCPILTGIAGTAAKEGCASHPAPPHRAR
jgi:hypothetical protein